MQQRRHIRALERELERSDVVVAKALGKTFRAREKEAAWRQRVMELESMMEVVGTGGTASAGGSASGVKEGVSTGDVTSGNKDREVDELREKLSFVVRERDEALRCLAEVRKVMVMAAAS